METIGAEQITQVAQGVSDVGMTIIAGSVFILVSIALWIGVFNWFRKIIDNMIANNTESMEALLKETREQNVKLSAISENLRPETLMRIKSISSAFFDLSKEQVCRLIKKVREENHISDEATTKAKIRSLLETLHEDRNSRFDNFTYRGRRLSEYTSTEWIDKVAQVFECEIYHVDGANNGRAYTNVTTVYDQIKIDFYHRLNH